ncbi:MAG: GtrA family protein [Erysipelotrichaceae bacterium]|nr:GtrA family protein [Erysipelotrichaceae bacterium]
MIRELFNKYQEVISYLFFGVLTTVVNYIIYFSLNAVLGEDLYLVNNVVAWAGAVIFAFVVNKFFVFKKKSKNSAELIKEMTSFALARLASLGIEEIILFIGMSLLKLNGTIVKLAAQVIVVILNYFFSKFFIFRK